MAISVVEKEGMAPTGNTVNNMPKYMLEDSEFRMEDAKMVNKKENPIRDGKPIKVLSETHKRLTDAKKAQGFSSFNDLFNWLLERAGL